MFSAFSASILRGCQQTAAATCQPTSMPLTVPHVEFWHACFAGLYMFYGCMYYSVSVLRFNGFVTFESRC